MAEDCRLSTALPSHPKTLKLERRLGDAGCWALTKLFLWVADNKSDGDLDGMSDEEIELSVRWCGEPGAFVRALVEVRFLDGTTGSYSIHDWAEHNPWAASRGMRIEAARKAAVVRWQKRGNSPVASDQDALRMPVASGAHAERTTARMQSAQERNAHHPTQPNPDQTEIKTSCEAPSNNDSASQQPVLITLPLNDKSEYPIAQVAVSEWQSLYPNVDVLQQLRNMRGWCLAKPERRKTRKGILLFVNNWLRKQQDGAPLPFALSVPSIPPPPKPDPVLEWESPANLDPAEGKKIWNAALNELSHQIDKHSFQTWFGPTKAAGLADSVLFVLCPHDDFCNVLDSQKYSAEVAKVIPTNVRVQYVSAHQEVAVA